jgi:RNA recognition motif-containing protein
MPVRLYVGNLPKEAIERQALQDLFVDAGEQVTTKLIKDRKTGKCRGFAFVTVPTDEMADQFIEKYNGQSFMETELKIEKALPRTKKSENENEEAKEPNTSTETDTDQAQTTKGQQENRPVAKSAAGAGKRSPKRQRNRERGNSNNPSTADGGSFQPDPRWASQLAQLKERFAAQPSP